MRKLLACLAGFGSGQCLPSPTLEFAGSVNSDIGNAPDWTLVSALGGRKTRCVVGERIEVHRPVAEGYVPVRILPGTGVLQPIDVVALFVILARMRPAGFGARVGRVGNHHR